MINKSISRSIAQLTRTIAQHNMPKAGMPRIACVLGFAILTVLSSSHAGPQGGQIRGGSGGIHQSGLNTTITQHSNALAIDWQGFDINSNESVRFIQPGSSAIALNRVLSNNASHIRGRLDANGHIVLVNPHGVFFGENATVNVGGLIASGLDINPNDFLNGDYVFSALEGSEGTVANYGLINAATGGSVSLLGRQVINDGMISARLGQVNLAAGNEVILTFEQGGLLGLKVSKAILQDELGVDPAVLNSGDIQAEGGQILLSGSVSQDLFSQALNMGDEQARSVVVHDDGSFTLGGGADVVNTGRLDASSMQGDAGDVIVLGENVTHEGVINASAINGNGGEVELHAADTTLLLGNAVVDASAVSAGTGGLVKLLGEKVGLLEQTLVDVSGALGGGNALVGGDYAGANPYIRNARRTFVESGVSLHADALVTGNGGRLIHWGDEGTWFYGTATARGGALSGNGGLIEISGEFLDYMGTVDTRAPHGELGTVLFDPNDIVVTTGNGTSNNFFDSNTILQDGNFDFGATFNISEADLESAITGSANFVLRARGNITIEPLSDGVFDLSRTGGFLSFIADANHNGLGSFTMETTDRILIRDTAPNDGQISSLIITAGDQITLGHIETQGGHVIIDGMGTEIFVNGAPNPPGITYADVNATSIETNGGIVSIGNGDAIDSSLVGTAAFDSDNLVNRVGGIGTVDIGSLDTGGAENTAGGDITINSGEDDIQIGTITTTGGIANGTDCTQAIPNCGAIGQDGLAGGAVMINALGGFVNITGLIDTSGSAGDYARFEDAESGRSGGLAGAVDIDASTVITTNGITSNGGNGEGDFTFDPGDGANAGDIELTAPIVRINGAIQANGGIGEGISGNQAGTPALSGNGGAITVTGSIVELNNDISVEGGVGIEMASDGALGSVSVVVNGNNGEAVIGYDMDFTANIAVTVDPLATGEQRLTGANRINDWLIDVAGVRTLNGNVFFSGIDNLRGNANTDTLNINAFGTTTTVNIGANLASGADISVEGFEDLQANASHTLIGESNSNNWQIISGGTSVDGVGFAGFGSIRGGDQTVVGEFDTFNISTDFGVLIDGGTGADEFRILAHGINVTSINGGTDSDNDTLFGFDVNNTWTLDGGMETLLSNDGLTTGTVTFSGIDSLTGGADLDTFELSTDLTGIIDGGSGADQFNINSINTSLTVSGGVNVVATDQDSLVTTFNDPTVNSIWSLAVADDDRLQVERTSDLQVLGTVNFSNIDVLQGNAQNDRFVIGDDFVTEVVSINGGAGASNTVDLRPSLSAINVDLSASPVRLGTIDINSIDTYIGNNDNHILRAGNGTNTWMFGSTFSVNGVNFSGFTSLLGGDGVDTFEFQNGTTVPGNINISGGANDDVFSINNGATVNASLNGAGETLNGDRLELIDFQSNITVDLENNNNNLGFNAFGIESYTIINQGAAFSATLIGENNPNTWSLTGTGFSVDGIAFTGFSTLQGGSDADTFDVDTNFSGNLEGGAGAAGNIFDLAAAVTLTGNITGDDGNDQIQLGDTAAVTGNIDGGEGQDTFTLGAGVSVGGVIDGGADSGIDSSIDRLVASNDANTWAIGSNADGNPAQHEQLSSGGNNINFTGVELIVGGTGLDTFSVNNSDPNTDVADIRGGTGAGINDVLDLSGYSTALSVAVGGGSAAGFAVSEFEDLRGNNTNHTLIGENNPNTWLLTSTGFSVDGIAFAGFSTLQGGSDADTFDVDTNFSGNLEGGTGTAGNLFDIASAVTLTGNITGDGGNDQIQLGDTAVVTGDIDGGEGQDTFTLGAGISIGGVIDGGTDSGADSSIDRLIASNNVNTWTIGSNSDGNPARHERLSSGANDINFTGVERIDGGTALDTFNVSDSDPNTDVADIRGGTGAGINDVLDLVAYTAPLSISIGGGAAAGFAIDGFEDLRGASNHTLIGENNPNTWTLNAGGFNVDGLLFSGFGTLQGGSDIDTFDISVGAGTLNGGSGADVFNILAPGVDVTIVGGDSPTGTFDKLNAFDIANTWSVNSGSQSISNMQGINTHIITFSEIESLTGGIDVDIFNLGLALAGFIDGDDGSDQFNIQTTSEVLNFNIDGGIDVGGGDSDLLTTTYNDSNFNSQWILGAAATDTLNIRLNSDNSVQASATFSNIENLQGNTQADSFVIQNNFSTSVANVNGGAGADNILDLSQFAATVTVDLTSSITVNGITANAVNTFVGNPAVNHTLRGQNDGDVWTFVASGFDNIDSSFNFSGFTTLQGGTGNDTFNFQTGAVIANNIVVNAGQGNDIFSVNNGATVNGTLNGGDAVTGDRLEVIGFQNDIVVDLGGNNNLGLNASDIETFSVINLAAGRSATLTGSDNGNFWVVNSALAFNSVQDFGANLMLDASDRIIQFAGFNILTGGDGADTFDVDTGFTGDLNGGAGMDLFDIAAGVNVDGDIGGDGGNDIVRLGNTASVTGSIDGGGGIDDQLDVSAFINPITVDLRVAPPLPLPTNTFSATGIEVYVANPIPSNTLIADNVANDWTIDGIGAFEQVGSVSFSGFSILQGGTLRDRFFISTGFDGTINANDGNDEFNLSENITITGNLNGQDGDDIFRLDDGVSAAAINGGNDNDEIDLTNLATATTLNLNNGSVTGLTITSSEIERYTANAGIVGNTIVGANFDNTWVVDGGVFESVTDSRGTPGDTSDDIQTEFRGFTVLQGGNAEDTFSVDANFTGDINGGLDNDVFNIANNVTINGNIRGGGDSDLLNVSAFLSPITIDLAGGNNQGIGFAATEFEEFMANAAVAGNQIIAANSTNDWILATGAGVLDELIDRQGPGALDDLVVGFSGFDTLTGGSGVDSFSIERDFVQGAINGGLGNDNFTIINGVNVTAVLDGGDTGVGVLNTLNITQLTNDITVELDGVSEAASTSINVARLQQISANNDAARNNTIIGDNVVNSWVLANNRSGSVDHATDGRLDFSGFRQLQGGNSQDTFFANIASNNDFFINGGSQGAQQEDAINTVFLGSSGGVNLEAMQLSNGIGFADIERFIGTPTGQRLTAENAVNVWTINPGNTGTISNPTSNISFSGFATLNGGSLIDTFNLNGAGAFAGTINAGDGNDVLTVAIDGSQTGNLRFNGDLGGADRIELSGGGPGITEVYTSNVGGSNVEQLTYTSGVNNFAVSYDGSSTEIINDNVQVDSLQVNGSAGSDTVLLGNGDFTVGSATPVGFNNKQNLIFNGGINDSLIINGPVSLLNGNLRINDFNISQTVTDRINVDQLILDASVVNGTLFTAIDAISILSASGAVDINELDAIELAGISTADAFTLSAAGRVNDTGQLSVQGDLLIDSGNGDIVLSQNNNLQGLVSLSSSGRVTVNNSVDINLGNVNVSDLTLTSGGGIIGSAAVAAGNAVLSATNDIVLSGSNINLNSLTISNAANANISNSSALLLTDANVSGALTLNSNGLNVSGPVNAGSNIAFDAGNGALQLDSLLDSNTGEIALVAADIIQNADITAANDVSLTSSSAINMASASVASSAQGDVRYVADGNIAVATLRAENGTAVASSTNGSIDDANGDTVNFVGERVEINAGSGVGVADNIETSAALLSVVNASGQINIDNTGDVELERLQTVGDIEFNNDLDIILQAGSVNGRFDVGDIILTSAQGSLSAAPGPRPSLANAHITGDVAIIALPFGTFNGVDIVANVNELFINALISVGRPETNLGAVVNDSSAQQLDILDILSSLTAEQSVEIEGLADVNLLVFEGGDNYLADDIPISMPCDQREDYEYDDCE